MRDSARWLLAGTLLACTLPAGAATDGVYHPYVNQGEREVEYGLTWRGLGDDSLTLQRASVAYSWTDRLSTELYLISEFPSHGDSRVRASELEVKWQLTEQGEYSSDWGLLFEVEVGDDIDRDEVAAGVLWEKELGGRWVAAANALLEYESGAEIENEFETAFRAQLRYRHRPAFEPAVELYLDDIDHAAGPAILGARPLGAGNQLRWELGLYFGLDSETPDLSLRTNLAFEF